MTLFKGTRVSRGQLCRSLPSSWVHWVPFSSPDETFLILWPNPCRINQITKGCERLQLLPALPHQEASALGFSEQKQMIPQTWSSNGSRQSHEGNAWVEVSSQRSLYHRMYAVLICLSNKFVYLKNSTHLLLEALFSLKKCLVDECQEIYQKRALDSLWKQATETPSFIFVRGLDYRTLGSGNWSRPKVWGGNEVKVTATPHGWGSASCWCFNDIKQTNKQNMLYFGKWMNPSTGRLLGGVC